MTHAINFPYNNFIWLLYKGLSQITRLLIKTIFLLTILLKALSKQVDDKEKSHHREVDRDVV